MFYESMPSKAQQNGGGRKKERARRLLNRADKIACLCTNANSSERLFTLPESRSFDFPPDLGQAACFFFSFFVPHCSPPPYQSGVPGQQHVRLFSTWRMMTRRLADHCCAAAAGCHRDQRQSYIIIRSLACLLEDFSLFFFF